MYPFYVQGRKILRLSIMVHEDCFLQPAQDVVKSAADIRSKKGASAEHRMRREQNGRAWFEYDTSGK